ncbi:MAG: hypothetical protein JSV26_08745 [bacterium]|nr:MAG: hypothetical protein JSV26_08745 [bacterium]
MGREEAISFIRDTLGCHCPDSVLHTVSFETRGDPDVLFSLVDRWGGGAAGEVEEALLVGGRLLILVCSGLRVTDAAAVLHAGVTLRDRQGFHRLRLVLRGGRLSEETRRALLSPFDDRVHIHQVSP